MRAIFDLSFQGGIRPKSWKGNGFLLTGGLGRTDPIRVQTAERNPAVVQRLPKIAFGDLLIFPIRSNSHMI